MKPALMFAALAAISSVSLADDCVLSQKTQVRATGVIESVRDIKTTVMDMRDRSRKCTVEFSARVNGSWNRGFGEYSWRDDRPDGVGCAVALDNGKSRLLELVGSQAVSDHKSLRCGEERSSIRVAVGQPIRENSWTPHPSRLGSFWYQGSECRWFIETDTMGRDLYQWQGIVCQVRPGEWVVVDKF